MVSKKTQGVCLICVVGFWPMGLQLQWGPRPNLVCSLFWLLNRNRLPCTLDVGLGWSALVSCPVCAFVRVVGFSVTITFQRWPSQSFLGEIHSTKHPSASTKACHRDWWTSTSASHCTTSSWVFQSRPLQWLQLGAISTLCLSHLSLIWIY